MDNFEYLIYKKHQGTAYVQMNRPEVFNALNKELLTELSLAFDIAQKDEEIKSIVLSGEGKAFCSGQDLKAVVNTSGTPSEILGAFYNPLIKKIRSVAKPVIARVHGVAAGAGFSLAIACDMVIASEKASFSAAFVRVGLVPDSGASWFLTQLTGRYKAFELCATGRQINAREALQLGLVNQVVAEGELDSVIKSVTDYFNAAPSKAVALIKEMINKSETANLDEMLDLEARYQDIAAATSDFQEGLKAFAEKRNPLFSGK